jgi:hypothetical protein
MRRRSPKRSLQRGRSAAGRPSSLETRANAGPMRPAAAEAPKMGTKREPGHSDRDASAPETHTPVSSLFLPCDSEGWSPRSAILTTLECTVSDRLGLLIYISAALGLLAGDEEGSYSAVDPICSLMSSGLAERKQPFAWLIPPLALTQTEASLLNILDSPNGGARSCPKRLKNSERSFPGPSRAIGTRRSIAVRRPNSLLDGVG